MNAIVAVDNNWGIGKDGKLLVTLSGDLRYFKNKTLGKTVIMGRKTLDSLPNGNPLPGRHNIVLTRDKQFEKEDCIVFNYISDIVEYIKTIDENDVFVIGGGTIYKRFLPFCDTFYITHILIEVENTDTYFPNLNEMEDIALVWKSGIKEEQGIQYYFAKYKRIKK